VVVNRVNLARALYRKVNAQKQAETFKTQLSQLSEPQLTLEQNQTFAQSHLP
jgi:hypothetical protein